jgi:hypothetical protein
MAEQLNRVEERIAREIREERSAREQGDAGTLEDVQQLADTLERLEEAQKGYDQRLAWLEKLMGVEARPVKPPKG